jgi:UDP-N-acetylmuramate dehydrogenase
MIIARISNERRRLGLREEDGVDQFHQSLEENLPLAPMTTLGIGGEARYFAEAPSPISLKAGLRWARERDIPLFILGGGSNIVVADRGFPGLVLRVNIRGVEMREDKDHTYVVAGAGEEWDWLVELTVARNLAGFESLSGIPGRVGATPIQNVGAYGRETSETLHSLDALDLGSGEIVKIPSEDCQFGYRASRFKTRDHGRFIITRVTYRLTNNGKPVIRYSELQKYLAEQGAAEPSLAEVRRAVIAIRKRKAMVIDPADPDSRSVGSFFVNPVVSLSEYEEIKERALSLNPSDREMPAFPAPTDQVKLSAAWLIERAGFKRGFVHGNVGTSSKHSLAIINRGGGTAREVIELKNILQTGVLERFGVRLVPEPVFVGFEDNV